MSDTLVSLVPSLSLALLVAFLVHSYLVFRKFKSAGRFFRAWIFLWVSFTLLYIPAVLRWSMIEPIGPFLDLFSSHLLALALFLCAGALRAGEGDKATSSLYRRTSVAWTCVVLLSLAISAIVPHEWMYASSSVLSFLGMSLYASRHASAFPQAKDSVLLLLFVYAGLQLVYAAANFPNQTFALTAFLLSLPLKVVLYLSGYATLYHLVKESGDALPAPPARRSPRRRKPVNPVQAQQQPPEPEVTIELSGVLGFLYLAWRYPSGKALLFLLLASLLSGLLFLSENTREILDIGKELSVVLEE